MKSRLPITHKFVLTVLSFLLLFRLYTVHTGTSNMAEAKKNVQVCLNVITRQRHNNFNRFFADFSDCISNNPFVRRYSFDVFEAKNYHNTKYMLPMVNTAECRWLTVGTDNDTSPERAFKKLYPK